MSDLPPISGKVGLDTTDFKSGLSEMNRDIRVIESAFKASVAGLEDWGKSATGLESRIKALNEQIEIQKRKVGSLQGEYERVAGEQGAGSRAAEELAIKLNKEVEALGKMQKELNQSESGLKGLDENSRDAAKGVDELGDETDGSIDALEKLKSVASGLKTGLEVGVTAIAGLAAAVAGVGLAIGKLVTDSAELAGELTDTSLQTGISTERLQELAYVGDQVGTSAETVTGSLSKLTRSMDTAQEQQKKFNDELASGKMEDEINVPIEMAAAFNGLGVAFTDAQGNLRDSETVFAEVIDALGGVANETERDALAMEIFGKSAMELNPLIKAGSDEIARLSEEARTVGAVMSEDTVAGLESFGDTLASLKAGLQGTLGELAGAFAPAFQGLANTAQTYLGQFSEIVRGADGDLVKMAKGVGDLIGDIANDIATRAPEFLEAGLNIIQGILNAITENLPKLLEAAIDIIHSLVEFIVKNLPMIIDAGVQILLMLVNAIVDNLPMLVEAGIKAVISLIEGLAEAMPQLIPAIVEAIILITRILIENLPLLVEAGGKLLIGIVEGIIEALPALIEAMPELVEAMVDALILLLPLMAEIGFELLKAVIKGIVENLPAIGEAIVKLGLVLAEIPKRLLNTVLQIGKDIVLGVWQGIQDNKDWFFDQIEGFFMGMVNAVRDALLMHSPSGVFAAIGENAGMSYVDSLGAALRDGQTAIGKAFGATAKPAFAMAGGGAAGPATVNNYYLSANYPAQSAGTLAADVRLLQMLYGEA
jgi:phage-related protein